MIRFFIIFSFVFITAGLHGQVVFNEPPALTAVLKRYIASNKSQNEIDGWRIQVLATTDRRQLEQSYRRFKETFPDLKVEWVHQEPYYKITAGAFVSRRTSLAMCQEVRKQFSQALPVVDRIPYDEIINK